MSKPDWLLAAVIDTARAALEAAPKACRYHGTDFGKLGFEPWDRNMPRCESCRQPYLVTRALAAIRRHDGFDAEGAASPPRTTLPADRAEVVGSDANGSQGISAGRAQKFADTPTDTTREDPS